MTYRNTIRARAVRNRQVERNRRVKMKFLRMLTRTRAFYHRGCPRCTPAHLLHAAYGVKSR